MSIKPQPVRGTQSLYGTDADKFHRVVRAFNKVRQLYQFRRVEVPVFEHTEVFARSIGETTDIVSKEMYTFPDKGGDLITLRPEFTAGVVRAYLSEGWQQHSPFKVATWGPIFRYERPQKGRFRQFHQIDAEVIGAAEPAADVELIAFASQLLDVLRISEFTTLQINTLGDSASRESWREALVRYFKERESELSDSSRMRLQTNPLRILDSKEPEDQQISAAAPTIEHFLTPTARRFFDEVCEGLRGAGISFENNPRLVRGLDYYRHTAFEFTTTHLGAQGTLIGGGRYDGLVETFGGQPTPAVGWAGGIERIALLLPRKSSRFQVMAVAPENEAAEPLAQEIALELRRRNIRVDYIYRGSARKRLEKYQRRGATTVIFVDVPESHPEIIGTLNIKQYRHFRYSSEQKVREGLSELFDVLKGYDVLSEGRVDDRIVDFVLKSKSGK